MSLNLCPKQGTIVICDFKGFIIPEMVKRRPAIVISKIKSRAKLCTIVPCSTTPPNPVESYHYKLVVAPPLPKPYNKDYHWVKADMIYNVSWDRLQLPFSGKDDAGKRIYDLRIISDEDLVEIQKCVLHSLGLSHLTNYI
ncbi:MAG: type II toxin-antitoxin system PemK/MazF family toxin [Thiotrichaceae bacterium]|nr:type II toxin-antitoxin system PemK/MazF family toxin [Thiotrichaceae bacterium]